MRLSKTACIAVLMVAAALWSHRARAGESPDGETTAEGETSPSTGEDSSTKSKDDSKAEKASNEEPDDGSGGRQSRANGNPPTAPDSSLSTGERLQKAEDAFRNGDFSRIPPLLQPVLGANPKIDDGDERIRARELLGVGLFFKAQQATDPKRRDSLMGGARKQFLELLRERPDYKLDSLIFPASVVEVFQSVRKEHAEELEKLRKSRRVSVKDASSASSSTLYIERSVERHTYALNFFPLGVGQFQNDQPLKGVLFGSAQLAGVAVHTIGYFQIQSLTASEVRSTQQAANLKRRAFRWRIAQYAAWGVVGLFYGLSIGDALLNYEESEIHIRTRDEPPPELSSTSPPAGNGPRVRIGLGNVTIRW